MEDIIHLLALILPFVACSSAFLLFTVNIYLKVRRFFPVKVNCWFCNQWTKVPYDSKDSFECPTCLQYNGFTPDGDYNKPIPAQHDELLNRRVSKRGFSSASPSNGLCTFCNNNQQLKVYQLANFVPLNEANYDAEVEHFEKQLEKAYKLCKACQKTVKSTISKQNCLLGLKFANLKKKGLLLLDLNNSSDGISKETKWTFLKTTLKYTLIGFSILNLIHALMKVEFLNLYMHKAAGVIPIRKIFNNAHKFHTKFLRDILSSSQIQLLLNIYESCVDECWNFLNYLRNVWLVNYVCSLISFELKNDYILKFYSKMGSTAFLCFTGLFFQLISLFIITKTSMKRKLILSMLWMILISSHLFLPSNIYFPPLQIVGSLMIITLMTSAMEYKPIKKNLKRLSKKHRRKPALDEFSDTDEVELHTELQTGYKRKPSPAKSRVNKIITPPAKSLPQFGVKISPTAKESLNTSFISARSCLSDRISLPDTASLYSTSFYHSTPPSNDKEFDIDISLNKLHLGTPTKRSSNSNIFYNTAKPVLSPPRFTNVTQNSWVAGGFWRNANGVLIPCHFPPLSRSSSQTSGFASQANPFEHNFTSPPPSLNSFGEDFENHSVFSEPAYYSNNTFVHNGIRTSPNNPRRFYPVLNHEELLYIAPCGFPYHVIGQGVSTTNHMPQNVSNVSPKINLANSSFVIPGRLSSDALRDWTKK